MTDPIADPAVAACAASLAETAVVHDLLAEILAARHDPQRVETLAADALDACERLAGGLALEA